MPSARSAPQRRLDASAQVSRASNRTIVVPLPDDRYWRHVVVGSLKIPAIKRSHSVE